MLAIKPTGWKKKPWQGMECNTSWKKNNRRPDKHVQALCKTM